MCHSIDAIESIRSWQAAAEEVSKLAGALLLRKLSEPRTLERKAYRDFVTDADMASQELITGTLRERFPHHGYLAEESDPTLPASGPIIWVIDPVDGTTNYSRQQPSYCVSIAAMTSRGRVLAGAIYDPTHDELYSAGEGLGAWRNGTALHASEVNSLEDAVIGFDWSRQPTGQRALLETLGSLAPHVHTVRGIGSAALALAWVAAGRLDGYVNFGLKAWDAAAGSLIISESGGRLTGHNGIPWGPDDTGCLAGNATIHASMLPFVVPTGGA